MQYKTHSANKIIMNLQIGTIFHANMVRTDNIIQILVLLALCVSNGYIKLALNIYRKILFITGDTF